MNLDEKVVLMASRKSLAVAENKVLDSSTRYVPHDLLKHVPPTHIMRRMADEVSLATEIPSSTAFLVGLGVFSGMAARNWVVTYPDGTPLPLGLYVVAEQPSGTSKTRVLRLYQEPFTAGHHRLFTELKNLQAKAAKSDDKDQIVALLEQQKVLRGAVFITNTTSEGLELMLIKSGGFFTAVSSEQGLFNSLFGNSYKPGVPGNNDIVLSGFDGGYCIGSRVSRESFAGHVVGGIVSLAQDGSIAKVLEASNGTGLAERFLSIAEPHRLGVRDHTRPHVIDQEVLSAYAECCQFFDDTLTPGIERWHCLHKLTISPNGFFLIAQVRNSIEPHLADGLKYSSISLRGAASKIDMQIMKLAANLHVMANQSESLISDDCVVAAISIAHDLLLGSRKLSSVKALIGRKAEFESIMSLFVDKPLPRSLRVIIQAKNKTRPFKEYTGNVSGLIRDTVLEMVAQGLLLELPDGNGGTVFTAK
jgi:hypothetical protein